MNKIKDFIYNVSDILVALIILIIATFVILWRMNVVVSYPSTVLRDGEVMDEVVIDTSYLPVEDDSLWQDGKLKTDLSLPITEDMTDDELVEMFLQKKIFTGLDELERVLSSSSYVLSDRIPADYYFLCGETRDNILDTIFVMGPAVIETEDENIEEESEEE